MGTLKDSHCSETAVEVPNARVVFAAGIGLSWALVGDATD